MLHRAVVTGSGGFVGRALLARLSTVERLGLATPGWRERIDAAPLAGAVIFHLAARVHCGSGDEAAFTVDNVEKTQALATAAVRAGARRLVFASTIKVHGEESGERPFREDDAPAPSDAYARSKLEAEQALRDIARDTELEVVVVRPPLVYGAGARANLHALVRLADTPLPLPFAGLHAERSYVHVDDLARLLFECAEQPQAAGRTYIAAHEAPVSISLLTRLMRRCLGRPERLFRVPAAVIEAAATAAGQRERALRLTRPLLADASAARRELRWTARVPIEQAIEEVVRDYRARHPL